MAVVVRAAPRRVAAGACCRFLQRQLKRVLAARGQRHVEGARDWPHARALQLQDTPELRLRGVRVVHEGCAVQDHPPPVRRQRVPADLAQPPAPDDALQNSAVRAAAARAGAEREAIAAPDCGQPRCSCGRCGPSCNSPLQPRAPSPSWRTPCCRRPRTTSGTGAARRRSCSSRPARPPAASAAPAGCARPRAGSRAGDRAAPTPPSRRRTCPPPLRRASEMCNETPARTRGRAQSNKPNHTEDLDETYRRAAGVTSTHAMAGFRV